MDADLAADRARTRSAIGPWGAWSFGFAYAPVAAMRDAARAIEATGYGCLWYPETLDSHEAYTNAATLLAATERLHVATGIASIWSRDARASVQAARTLADASDDRFILGLGVSHRPLVTARGYVYDKPVATMRAYLDAMAQAGDAVPLGDDQPPIHVVLAGLRPPMLRLAAERSLGAHPYLVTVDHTRRAREVMGPDPLLLVEHKVVLETHPDVARAKARAEIEWYLGAENYLKNLLWLGFTEDDVADGGSDRLVDELVFWGDEDAIVGRLRAHHAAGADHVAIHPVRDERDPLGVETFARLAAHLA
ncbi:MAG: TIGR03620 family F420-dependent LLM class oxidoreductase [Actinobacteria bacterium]|nr:TIGR03620 family F420-dependent LLM class oxidoreductase [Actinomycetota bacterium]